MSAQQMEILSEDQQASLRMIAEAKPQMLQDSESRFETSFHENTRGTESFICACCEWTLLLYCMIGNLPGFFLLPRTRK